MKVLFLGLDSAPAGQPYSDRRSRRRHRFCRALGGAGDLQEPVRGVLLGGTGVYGSLTQRGDATHARNAYCHCEFAPRLAF